jgi:tetratricopeptide (TPR) repeat protein
MTAEGRSVLTDLSVTPISETLRRLSAARLSGDLHIRSGRLAKIVFLDHGRLVFAASNLKKDRLGEALVAVGRITGEQFDKAQALMKGDRKRRFGEALIHAGVMNKQDLGRSVARQVRRIVLSLFELPEGAGAFEERPCPIPLEYMVSLSIHSLLYDGIRLIKDREPVLKGLGNLDRPLVRAVLPPFEFDDLKCSTEEREILELARRQVTVRRLAWAPGGPSTSRLRAVYALFAGGVLQDPATAAEEPVVQMETGTFLLSALHGQADPTGLSAIRKEVQDEIERSAKMDRERWLKLTKGSPRAELIRALEEKMERYHALREAVGDDEQTRTDIEVVLGRVSAMLRLARENGAPDVASTQPTPSPVASPPPAASPPAPRSAPVAPEMPISPTSEPALSDPGPSLHLEHLLMEADVRMTVSDYANAVRVYEKVVQMAPHVSAYRARLAIAMAFWPPTAKQAEREFLDALRLEPDNADLHYQFGIYYKTMRQRARAAAEMRTVLRLNPRHLRAREELEILSPKDSALTSIKKLFR